MAVLWWLMVVMACVACGSAEKRGKVAVCRGAAKCIWLNEYLQQRRLPLYSSVQSEPDVFCYEGHLSWRGLLHLWDSLYVTVEPAMPKTVAVFSSNSSTRGSSRIVYSRAVEHLNPFKTRCVGVLPSGAVASPADYGLNARLQLWPGYPVMALVGYTLLFKAPQLSRNVPLIYGTGITLGILASVLVILYVLSRYVPGRSFVGLGFLAGGYTAVGAFCYWAMDSVMELMVEYWQYVLLYVCVSGFLSFAAMYRWGGVNNPRTFDLIQWGLQLFALSLLYLCAPVTELSIGMVVLALFNYKVPVKWNPLMLPLWFYQRLLNVVLFPLRWCWWRVKGPPVFPKKKLLTPEEFEAQGRRETAKELKRLQQYCQEHPEELDNVKHVSRNRMARFTETGKHLTEEEQVNHEWAFVEESDSEGEASNSIHSPTSSLGGSSAGPPSPPQATPTTSRYHSEYRKYYTSPAYSRHSTVT